MKNKKNRRDQVEQTLQQVNLEHKKDEKIKNFSGGMKQRLGIAQAIVHNTKLLLVDEPTAGLDPEERIRFRNLLRELAINRTVLLSTHITEDISMTCDKVCIMNNGTLHYYESLRQVKQIALNKVWETNLSTEEYSRIKSEKGIQVISASENEKRKIDVRLICNNKPFENALPAEPTLEEGYMIWLTQN